MRILVVAAVALALSACASIHEGNLAEPVSGDGNRDLVISGVELNNQMTEPFALLAFTFENKSDDWIRIARVD